MANSPRFLLCIFYHSQKFLLYFHNTPGQSFRKVKVTFKSFCAFLISVILWFTIRNIYLVFILISVHSSEKCWNVLIKATQVLYSLQAPSIAPEFLLVRRIYVNKDGAGCQGNQLLGERVEFIPTPWPQGRGAGLRLSSVTNSWWFNQSCLHNEASIKTWKRRILRASSQKTHAYTGREWGAQRAWKLWAPFHTPCPKHLFLLFLGYMTDK